MIDEHAFRSHSDAALNDLFRALNRHADNLALEADLNAGALTIEFEEPPGRFVVSPNAPVRQIWVSAHSKSYKLDWDESRGAFVLPGTGQDLRTMMAEAIAQQVGQPVTL